MSGSNVGGVSSRRSSSSESTVDQSSKPVTHTGRKVFLVAVVVIGTTCALLGCYVSPMHQFFVGSSGITTAGQWIIGASSVSGTGCLAFIFWPLFGSPKQVSSPKSQTKTPATPPDSRRSSIGSLSEDDLPAKPITFDDQTASKSPAKPPAPIVVKISPTQAPEPSVTVVTVAPRPQQPQPPLPGSVPSALPDLSHIALPAPTANGDVKAAFKPVAKVVRPSTAPVQSGSGGAAKTYNAFTVRPNQVKVDARGSCLFLSFAVGAKKMRGEALNDKDAIQQQAMYAAGTSLRQEAAAWMTANIATDATLQKAICEGLKANLETALKATTGDRDFQELWISETTITIDDNDRAPVLRHSAANIKAMRQEIAQRRLNITACNQQIAALNRDLQTIQTGTPPEKLALMTQYIEKLKASNTFATEAEIYALSQIRQTCIRVAQVPGDEPPAREVTQAFGPEHEGNGTIFILFKKNHYDFWKAVSRKS